jgi:hypothetical protein
VDYETNDSGHLTSAHLTTDGGQLSIALAPAGIVVSVKGTAMHIDREDVAGIIDVLADFVAALEEVE